MAQPDATKLPSRAFDGASGDVLPPAETDSLFTGLAAQQDADQPLQPPASLFQGLEPLAAPAASELLGNAPQQESAASSSAAFDADAILAVHTSSHVLGVV